MKYRAEIDGLRAIAVVPVVLFHAGFDLFSGGFVGVDVFFVISGYLITTILVNEIGEKRFSLVNFYERRARRILPALFFVLLICIPFAWMWMLPSQMKDFSQSLVSVSLFSSNILFWLESGYFSTAAESKPLLHTWSLAVEEQYYLLFPIVLLMAWRFGRNRVFWIIVVMASISFLISEWGWRNKPVANFYLAPSRAWELLAGSISAFVVQDVGVKKNQALSLVGLSLIVFAIFGYDETTPFPSIYALVPVVGVVLILLYADKNTLTAKILSNRLLVSIGLISYSVYLWHQPLFAFARIKLISPSLPLMGLLVVMALVAGFLSWKYIEKPFRSTKFYQRRDIFLLSLVGFLFFSGVGIYGSIGSGVNDARFSDSDLELLAFSTNYKGRTERDYWNRPNSCYLINAKLEKFESGGCLSRNIGSGITILLIGDSHSGYLSEGLVPYLNKQNINVLQLSVSHCAILGDSSDQRCNEILSRIKSLVSSGGIHTVVEFHSVGTEKFSSHPRDYKRQYIENLKYIASYVENVFVIGQMPTYSPSLPGQLIRFPGYQALERLPIEVVDSIAIDEDKIRSKLISDTQTKNIKYISLFDYLCNETGCRIRSGENFPQDLIIWDDGHLSESGAHDITSRLIGPVIALPDTVMFD